MGWSRVKASDVMSSQMSWASAFGIPNPSRSFAQAAGRVVIDEDAHLPRKKRKRRTLKAALSVTETAAQRIKRLLEGKDDVVGVRIGVVTRGCNGLSYTMNYAKDFSKFEEVVNDKGVTVVIESKALMHVVGTTMDFVTDELTSEFVFHNPNAKGACGCGESFNT